MDLDFFNKTTTELLHDTSKFHKKILGSQELRNLYATLIIKSAEYLTHKHECTEPFEKMLIKFIKLN